MQNESTFEGIVCDLTAIPAEERESHLALGRSLLANYVIGAGDNEVRFELGADRLSDVTRFIENERRCCQHLAFSLDIPARSENLTVRVSGPGVRDELDALIRGGLRYR